MKTKKIPVVNPATGAAVGFVDVAEDDDRKSIPMHEYLKEALKRTQDSVRVVSGRVGPKPKQGQGD